VYYGVLRVGAVVVPMNPMLKEREIAYYLSDSGAPLIFAWHTSAAQVGEGAAGAGIDTIVVDSSFDQLMSGYAPAPDLVERDPGDSAVILYTSGTTGHPKGAELTHRNLIENAKVTTTDLLDLNADDVVFGGLPLFHAFGQTVALNTTVGAGGTLVLLPRFDAARALQLMAEYDVSVFAGVPTMYGALLDVPDATEYGLDALRVCVSGGAAMPVELLHRFESVFGVTVLEGYGLSETSPVASFNHPDRLRKPGSIGTPVRGIEMRIVDESGKPVTDGEIGEITIRGHNVMKGYLNKPEASAEAIDADGWFRSGDMGRIDGDGYFFIVDRKKDLIVRGGYNVYPREIEEVLYEHPAVREAAVIGIPDPRLGEEIAAAVSLKPGSQASAEELRAHVKAQVAAYKYPRRLWIVDQLPKGPTGKLLKREISVPDSESTA
jgi:long-chain acyl-CoA synthetase